MLISNADKLEARPTVIRPATPDAQCDELVSRSLTRRESLPRQRAVPRFRADDSVNIDADWLKWGIMVVLNIGTTFGAIRARLNAMDKRDDDIEGCFQAPQNRLGNVLQ